MGGLALRHILTKAGKRDDISMSNRKVILLSSLIIHLPMFIVTEQSNTLQLSSCGLKLDLDLDLLLT